MRELTQIGSRMDSRLVPLSGEFWRSVVGAIKGNISSDLPRLHKIGGEYHPKFLLEAAL